MTLAEYIREATDSRMAEVIVVLHKVFAEIEAPPKFDEITPEDALQALQLDYDTAKRLFKKLEPANAES